MESSVKLRNFLTGAVGATEADTSSPSHKLEKSSTRMKAEVGFISSDIGHLCRHLHKHLLH